MAAAAAPAAVNAHLICMENMRESFFLLTQSQARGWAEIGRGIDAKLALSEYFILFVLCSIWLTYFD